MTKTKGMVLVLAASILILSSCNNTIDSLDPVVKTEITFEQFLVEQDLVEFQGNYIYEKDVLLPKSEVEKMYEEYVSASKGNIASDRATGQRHVWTEREKKNITYAFWEYTWDPELFPPNEVIRQSTREAAQSWNTAAEGNIEIREDAENPVFYVIALDGDYPFAAMAFFPHVAIFPGFPPAIFVNMQQMSHLTPEQVTGVMEHEIGHTLGLAHEHQRADAPFDFGQGQFGEAFGDYDPLSIMDYRNGPFECGISQGDTETINYLYGRDIFIIQDGNIYKIDKNIGTSRVLDEGKWQGSTAITAIDNDLFVINNGNLHKINPDTGISEIVGDEKWYGLTSLTGSKTELFGIQNGTLYKIDPETGSREALGSKKWYGPVSMTTLDGSLFVVHNGSIYKIDPSTGEIQVIGDSSWYGQTSIAGIKNNLYITRNGKLYKVNAASGEKSVLCDADWSRKTAVASIADDLYLIKNGGGYKINTETGGIIIQAQGEWNNILGIAVTQ